MRAQLRRRGDQNGVGNNTIKNLGTNADLYYGLSADNNTAFSSVIVGAGTAWKGISTDRNARISAINALSRKKDDPRAAKFIQDFLEKAP